MKDLFFDVISQLKFKKPSEVNIFVAGDFMLDKYIFGSVTRISPEAPVPVLNVEYEEITLGGAGNVVHNLSKLGANVICSGVIGDDQNGDHILHLLNEYNVKGKLEYDKTRGTIVKTRFVTADSQTQLLRVDREHTKPYTCVNSLSIPKNIDFIVVSDYAKGFITDDIMKQLRDSGHKIIVDPKPQHCALYEGVHIITPNKKEYNEMLPMMLPNADYIIKTLGKQGLDVIDFFNDKTTHIPAKEVNVYNVSGCGDTIVALLTLCLSMGMNIIDAAEIANEGAGIVAGKPGTAFVTEDEFFNIVINYLQSERKCVK